MVLRVWKGPLEPVENAQYSTNVKLPSLLQASGGVCCVQRLLIAIFASITHLI